MKPFGLKYDIDDEGTLFEADTFNKRLDHNR